MLAVSSKYALNSLKTIHLHLLVSVLRQRSTTQILFHPDMFLLQSCRKRIEIALCGSQTVILNIFRTLSNILQVFLGLFGFLLCPDAENPPCYYKEMAELYKTNKEKFDSTAREWTEMYAMQPEVHNE